MKTWNDIPPEKRQKIVDAISACFNSNGSHECRLFPELLGEAVINTFLKLESISIEKVTIETILSDVEKMNIRSLGHAIYAEAVIKAYLLDLLGEKFLPPTVHHTRPALETEIEKLLK